MAAEVKLDFLVTHSMRQNKAVVDLDIGSVLQMLAGKLRNATSRRTLSSARRSSTSIAATQRVGRSRSDRCRSAAPAT